MGKNEKTVYSVGKDHPLELDFEMRYRDGTNDFTQSGQSVTEVVLPGKRTVTPAQLGDIEGVDYERKIEGHTTVSQKFNISCEAPLPIKLLGHWLYVYDPCDILISRHENSTGFVIVVKRERERENRNFSSTC
jgi:hypothetical protein